MRLQLDKVPRFRYAVLSMLEDAGPQVTLESSFVDNWKADSMFDSQYSKWGFEDTNFYLVDWQEQRLIRKHEVFVNDWTAIITARVQ